MRKHKRLLAWTLLTRVAAQAALLYVAIRSCSLLCFACLRQSVLAAQSATFNRALCSKRHIQSGPGCVGPGCVGPVFWLPWNAPPGRLTCANRRRSCCFCLVRERASLPSRKTASCATRSDSSSSELEASASLAFDILRRLLYPRPARRFADWPSSMSDPLIDDEVVFAGEVLPAEEEDEEEEPGDVGAPPQHPSKAYRKIVRTDRAWLRDWMDNYIERHAAGAGARHK